MPFYQTIFAGALCLFLLELGMDAAKRLEDFWRVGWRLALFGIAMPLVGGAIGLAVAHAWLGFGPGGMTLVAVLGASIRSVIFAIAVVSWPPMARLVRGEFMAMRNREFVQACVAMGMGHLRIIFVHILPNTLSSIIVTGSLMVATAILIESGLSFLGLSDANTMSWGFIIGSGRTVLRTAWWICAMPGAAILMTVMAINLVGDGLNDALNPRLRSL